MYILVVVADAVVCPCLWVGTSLGSVLVVAFGMPTDGARNTEPVSVMPSGMLDAWQLVVSQWYTCSLIYIKHYVYTLDHLMIVGRFHVLPCVLFHCQTFNLPAHAAACWQMYIRGLVLNCSCIVRNSPTLLLICIRCREVSNLASVFFYPSCIIFNVNIYTFTAGYTFAYYCCYYFCPGTSFPGSLNWQM